MSALTLNRSLTACIWLALLAASGCGEQPSIISISPETGSTEGGTQVTVTGTAFTDVRSVTIGGQSLTGLLVASRTSLIGTTSAGMAGAQDVVVTTAAGSATLSAAFTYVPVPPSVTSISPNTGPISGGTAITIAGANLAGASSVTIGGQSLVGLTVASSSSLTGTTPAGTAGPKDVVVTTPGGSTTLSAGFTYLTAVRQLGSAGDDFVTGATRDGSGNILIVGHTDGSFPGFTNAGGRDVFVAKLGSGGATAWIQQIGTAGDDIGVGIATDSAGNVYVSGDTTGAFSGNTNAGAGDLFVIKLDGGSGATQWIHQAGTSGNEVASEIDVDGTGNVYLTGRTTGSFPTFTNAGSEDLVVIKLNGSGAEQWVKQLGTVARDQIRALALDAAGAVYIGGQTTGSFPTFTNAGLNDAFVIKLDAAGATRWIQQLGTADADVIYGLDVGPDGYIYAAGGTLGSFSTFTNAGSDDLFVVKLDNLGAQQWLQQAGTAGSDVAFEIAAGSSGAYVTGDTYGSFPGFTNAGGADLFVIKLGTNGAQQWTRQLGTAGDDSPRGLDTDGSDNLSVAGSTSGTFPGLTSAGANDLFLLEYTSSGDVR